MDRNLYNQMGLKQNIVLSQHKDISVIGLKEINNKNIQITNPKDVKKVLSNEIAIILKEDNCITLIERIFEFEQEANALIDRMSDDHVEKELLSDFYKSVSYFVMKHLVESKDHEQASLLEMIKESILVSLESELLDLQEF